MWWTSHCCLLPTDFCTELEVKHSRFFRLHLCRFQIGLMLWCYSDISFWKNTTIYWTLALDSTFNVESRLFLFTLLFYSCIRTYDSTLYELCTLIQILKNETKNQIVRLPLVSHSRNTTVYFRFHIIMFLLRIINSLSKIYCRTGHINAHSEIIKKRILEIFIWP